MIIFIVLWFLLGCLSVLFLRKTCGSITYSWTFFVFLLGPVVLFATIAAKTLIAIFDNEWLNRKW